MIKKYERLSLVLGVPGIFLMMLGAVLAQSQALAAHPVALLICISACLMGIALFVFGVVYYSKARGYRGWEQFSWCHPYGILTLLTMRDKTKDLKETDEESQQNP